MHLKLVPTLVTEDEGWFERTESDLKLVPVALSEDGWSEKTEHRSDKREVSLHAAETPRPGDRVLYRCGASLVPAVLVEPAGGGQWLARDSRHGRNLFYLADGAIATRLTRPDLLG